MSSEWSDDELTALALRFTARRASDDWLEWEDVPELDEETFGRLLNAVQLRALWLTERSREFDRQTGIDSAFLQERVS